MTRDDLPDYSIFAKDSPPLEDYEVPKYTVTMQIQCDQHPSKWLHDTIYQYLEPEDDEYARITHIERYEDRPTSVEHHGGYPIPQRY